MSPPSKSKKSRKQRRRHHKQAQRQAEGESQRAEQQQELDEGNRESNKDLNMINTKQIVANLIHYIREMGDVDDTQKNKKLDDLEIVSQMTKVPLKEVQEIDKENISPKTIKIKEESNPPETPTRANARAREDDGAYITMADYFFMRILLRGAFIPVYYNPPARDRRASGRRYSGTTNHIRGLGYPGWD